MALINQVQAREIVKICVRGPWNSNAKGVIKLRGRLKTPTCAPALGFSSTTECII